MYGDLRGGWFMCASRQSGIAGYLVISLISNSSPWDREAVVTSIQKTGRCVIVHEAPKTSGFGAEMKLLSGEVLLESGIANRRVTGWDTPFPILLNGIMRTRQSGSDSENTGD